MRIAILSDTHGSYPLAFRALDIAGPVDHVIHLGDNIEDARILENALGLVLIKVPGNCDFETGAPRELVNSFTGKQFFISHGDRYGVKFSLEKLRRKALSVKAEVVLFGHTHTPLVQEIDGMLFVNPGCLSEACETLTFAIITIEAGCVSAELITLQQ